MYFGYNTNGWAHHRPHDAIRILRELGYEGVGLTIDHGLLDPADPARDAALRDIRQLLRETGMKSVVETGARFLLDPLRKHEPTLISPDAAARKRRVEFLQYAIDVAQELGSDCVSIWSGAAVDEAPEELLWERLLAELPLVVDHAHRRNVTLGFEPEPDMLVATLDDYAHLTDQIDSPLLKLTLDLGHVHCVDALTPADAIRTWADDIVNVHIEDMRRGVHDHLMFGEGEMDFPAIMAALRSTAYEGGVFVELSRHSHDAVRVAEQSRRFLQSFDTNPSFRENLP